MSAENPSLSSDNAFGIHYFPPTNWSLVNVAGHGAQTLQRQALNELVERYRPALQSHLVLHKRIDPDRAEDLIQGFMLEKVVKQEIIAHANRRRGKFRSFLLVSLDRFVIDQHRQATAIKRQGGGAVSIEDVQEVASRTEPVPNAYDVAWARQLLSETLDHMHRECVSSSRADIWAVFEGRLLEPLLRHVPPVSYERLVNQFGLASPAQASNVLVTGRRMFERLLRQAIGEYESSEQRIDEEIADLQRILSGQPPHSTGDRHE